MSFSILKQNQNIFYLLVLWLCCLFLFPQNFLTTVAILLEAGAYVNMQQSSGETALMKVNSVFVLTWFNRNTFATLLKRKRHICGINFRNMYHI